MNFYIFRHGETFETKNNIPYGERVYSADILPEGIPAIERLANYLKGAKTDANFSSPFKRCVQTTNIVTKITKKDFVLDDRIGEFVREKETFEILFKRIKNFTHELKDKNYHNIAVCTHGYPISALTQLISKGKISEEQLDSYPHPGILIEIKDKNAKFIDFNQESSQNSV